MGNQSIVKAWDLKWVQLTSSNMSQSVSWEIEFNLAKYIVTKCVIMKLNLFVLWVSWVEMLIIVEWEFSYDAIKGWCGENHKSASSTVQLYVGWWWFSVSM